MTTKSVLTLGAMALFTLGIASAKSYDIRLDNTTTVGSTQLKAGEYKVKVNGSQAVFMDANSSKSYTAAVKTGTSTTKFDQTTVQTTSGQNGMDSLKEIDLGGSNTKLEFESH
jgi:hypothetical protein